MALLSESMIEIIEANPIKDEFKTTTATFKSTYPNAYSLASYENPLTDRSTCNVPLLALYSYSQLHRLYPPEKRLDLLAVT